MTLDNAIEAFRAAPNLDTGTTMIDVAREYARDGMITWQEVVCLCDEARETLAIDA
jgi:hypothetical protein